MADVITRLKVESTEYDSKIKRASQGLLQMEQACRKVGGTLAILEKDELEFVKGLGKMETVSKDARGQLNELTKAFTDLSLQYKRLTDEEKQGDFGKALASSLGELKTRIQDTKKDLADIGQELSGSKFGQFGSIIDGIGHKMGVSANLTELLTSKTALMTAGIGAAVAAIYKGAEAWTKYNAELSKQDQITQVTTGLKGSGADRMTDVMRAVSDTYKVDFREAINAANTLMTQFGKSGDEAIQLIKDGMQGMIQGDGGKLLNMIQQFAPAFRDAGISADKLVAIIHNSEGGLFSDQNMNAILMGIKNIRLMTRATSESLAKLGIDGQEMSRKMADGSMTVFEALKQVATKLKDCEAGSQEAGQVMQNVFGRQGAMQGMKLARAIAELNTNIEETKKQTGELGDAFAELQAANEKLNTAIRDAFSYDGWEQMATGIKANLISTLADVIEKLGKIRDFVAPGGITTRRGQNRRVEGEVKDVQSATQGEGDSAKIKQQQILDKYDREIAAKRKELERTKTETNDGVGAPYATTIRLSEKTKEDIEKEIKALQKMKEEFRQESNKVITTPSPVNTEPEKPTPEPKPKPGTVSTSSTPKTETQQNETAIAKLTEEYQNLATAAKTADDAQKAGLAERMTAIRGEIKTLQERNAELKKFADEAKGVKVSVGAEGSLPQLTQQLKDLQQAQSQSLDTREWVEYQKQIDVTNTKIDILKGKWRDGQVATFSIDANNTEAYDLLKNLEGVNIGEETITITADTAEAYNKVQEIISGIEGTSVSFEVNPQMKPLPTLDDYRIQAMIELDTANTKVDTSTLQTILKDAIQQSIDITSLNLEPLAEQIGNGINVPDEKWQEILDKYNELRAQIGEEPIQIDFKSGKIADDGKSAEKSWKSAASAIQSVGSAFSQIEDPAAKVAGIVAQAIATVASAYAQALATDWSTKSNIWAFIAAAAASTASMVTTIATIHSATGFAEGGIVPGNNFSGDNLHTVDYGINSGELILNRSQQSTIASALMDAEKARGGYAGTPYVTGEKIVMGVNNWGRSTGRGQLVFSKS